MTKIQKLVIALIFVFAVLLDSVVKADIILTSCARMDTPFLSKIAAGACITSCKYQNCGTGRCQKRSGRPVCVCSRCGGGGGAWPNIPSKGRK